MKTKLRVLIVDDNSKLCDSLRDVLEDNGYVVEVCSNGKDATDMLRNNIYDIALIDYRLPDITGIELIVNLAGGSCMTEFILMTAYASLDSAIEAVKQIRVISYELKPLNMDRLLSLLRQVVNRRKMEEEIQKLTHAVEQSSSTIIITDAEGIIEYANPRFTQLTGYSLEEVAGSAPRFLQSGKTSSEVYSELWKTIKSGNEWRGEFCNRKKNGDLYWESASISPVKNDKGHITHFIAVKEDISERKRMEEILLQSEKLKAMGIMTSGVAHDFNNLLAIISGNTQLLELKCKDKGYEEFTDALHTINKAIKDGADIVNRMVKFTKIERDVSAFVPVDIRELLQQAIDFTRPRWLNMAHAAGIRYEVDTKCIKKVHTVLGHPAELREVFINIINNALDAMGTGGTLSFRTWMENNRVFASITDTGEGMSEEIKKRIFDPFYTTKRAAGSGLGMSVAFGTISGCGGNINVESEEGKGTTFILDLPVSGETIQQAALPESKQAIARKLSVLIIDDEEDICRVLEAFFSADGHNVKYVTSGADAVKLIQNTKYDLVLCDLVMPGLTGYDIVKVLNQSDEAPVIGIISGWGEESILMGTEDNYKVDFILGKPFNFTDLTNHINEAIALR